MSRDSRRFDAAKRIFDIGASIIGLGVTAPLQIGIATVVRSTLGKPVLFRQKRPGKDGRIFELIKFRTMLLPDEKHFTDEERLTKVGKFLRSTSLDELPTFWNVLKGDMSIVGPRPLLVSYLDAYSPEQARRHEVRPGVTGLAQVRGRNSTTWEERLRLDVQYVDTRSFLSEIGILLQTVRAVLLRTGISQEGHATMTPFVAETPKETASEKR